MSGEPEDGEVSVIGSSTPQTLRERLAWDPAQGRVCDGPRRYLLMRPDVLMGAVVAMVPAYRQSFLVGWAQSTRDHGADSLRAYAQMVQGDHEALMHATVQAAADLGWGRWSLTLEDGLLHLAVLDSPFVAGWLAASQGRPSDEPVCAPIRGMLQALAEVVLQGPVEVEETHCRAMQPVSPGAAEPPATTGSEGLQAHAPACHFLARARRPA